MGYIGIDFGMQSIKVCYINDNSKLPMRVDLEGNQFAHSSKQAVNAVYYYEEEETTELKKAFFSSDKAEEARESGSPDYVCYIKSKLLDERYSRQFCEGKYTFSCLDIVTDIFKNIYERMKTQGCKDIETAYTVLTAPVRFWEMSKAKLVYCARKAGFNVSEIISEPFAALFCEGLEECMSEEKEQLVLIFDFGASTLDLCLGRLQHRDGKTSIKVLTSNGTLFGGKLITDDIQDYLERTREKQLQELKAQVRLKHSGLTDEVWDEVWNFKLHETAERLKTGLYDESDMAEHSERLYGEELKITRNEINRLLDDNGYWDKKIKPCLDGMLNDYNIEDISTDDISRVVMIGGTTKITYFRDKLVKLFGEDKVLGEPDDEDEYDALLYNSVSEGAALYALKSQSSEYEIENRLPVTLGFERKGRFEPVLLKSTAFLKDGRRIEYPFELLEQNNWRVNVYETESNLKISRSIAADKDLHLVGYIQLNQSIYSKSVNPTVTITISMTKQGIRAVTVSGVEFDKIEELEIITEVCDE